MNTGKPSRLASVGDSLRHGIEAEAEPEAEPRQPMLGEPPEILLLRRRRRVEAEPGGEQRARRPRATASDRAARRRGATSRGCRAPAPRQPCAGRARGSRRCPGRSAWPRPFATAEASTEPRYDIRHHVQHRLYEAGNSASMGRVRRGLGLGHRGTAHLRAGGRLPRQGRRGRRTAPRGGRVDAYRAGCGCARRLRRSLRPRRRPAAGRVDGRGRHEARARAAGRAPARLRRRPRRALHQRRR